MDLKLDESGNVVVQDGKPVYINKEGKEVPFDASRAMQKISELNNESKTHRLKAEELSTQLNDVSGKFKVYEGLDAEEARKALEAVKNFSDKQFVEAGEVEKLKTNLLSSANEEKTKILSAFEEEKKKLFDDLQQKERLIYNLTISSEFAKSSFLKDKTTMTSDVAELVFGPSFKVEVVDDKLIPVAYSHDGQKILSRKDSDQIANFEEAMEVLWEGYRNKDAYTPTKTGSGSTSNTAQNDDVTPQDLTKSFYPKMLKRSK